MLLVISLKELLQVVVTLGVDISRRVCAQVASGAFDCAIIGGDVPEELGTGLEVNPCSF